ncbi:protease complex subunit PrcB family protein [Flavobacterium sp.]|uniref:protease complex subunit PrcB family protein n=1 Tax=Flavobacterium sp. TaxID=239 RepID=UPI002611DCA3|nr:protease complex subunit PrcB family protein [Flavobacterium sp.]
MKQLTLICLLAISLFGCNSKKAATNGEEFTILAQSGYGGRHTESHELVKNEQQFLALCKELNIETIPQVDFTKNNVVAVFMGQKRSGGYSITVEKVVIDGNTAQVLVKNTLPEQGAMVTMALTAPYCVAAIPKTDKVIVKENPVLIEK